MVLTGLSGEPGRNRTFNQQIKSLLLCQLSYGPTRAWSLQVDLMPRLANLNYNNSRAKRETTSPERSQTSRDAPLVAQPIRRSR